MPRETPDVLRKEERNAFYESLAVAAKERFLNSLRAAEERGLDNESAWREAVVAAETTYAPEPVDADLDPGNI